MDNLSQYQQYVSALLQEHWGYFNVLLLVLILVAFYVLMHHQPRIKERWMRRKKERQLWADIYCEAGSQAVIDKKVTVKDRVRMEKKLGKALGLPDLIPKPKKTPVKDVKAAIKRRLYAMGIKVQEKLLLLRRSRPKRKSRLVPKYKPT